MQIHLCLYPSNSAKSLLNDNAIVMLLTFSANLNVMHFLDGKFPIYHLLVFWMPSLDLP